MYNNSVLNLIGNTPLVRVNFDTAATVYAKLEYFNPGGSIKDRAALFMIEQAELLGLLKPGGTIIEASSGNQGLAAAMIGAIKGYKVIITVSEKNSKEKQETLKAYGAKIVVCPATYALTDPDSYHSTAVRIHQATPNSFMLNQYFNEANAQAHYALLAPEIWRQTEGTITHFCAAAGTGGTIKGVGKFLKQQNSTIKVIGVDAATSYRSTQGNPQPYKLEGIGVDFDAPLVKQSAVDEFLVAPDAGSIAMLQELARNHGLLVGPSSGAVAYAIRDYARALSKSDVVVMIFGDSGRAYLSKNFYQDTEEQEHETVLPTHINPSNNAHLLHLS
jgi:cystathionine beta-synthase